MRGYGCEGVCNILSCIVAQGGVGDYDYNKAPRYSTFLPFTILYEYPKLSVKFHCPSRR